MDLYQIKFNPLESTEENFQGVYGISIVDDPANGINFIALSKTKEVKLATANEEKRLLVGPVLIPDQKIYRDWYGGCEIFFDAETIRLASQEFLKNGYQNNSTVGHTDKFINGVSFVESWIVEDSAKDKSSALGFDVPSGTWMVSMKVESDDIWNDFVKEGKVKGFSIDSFFDIEKVKVSLSKSKTNNKKRKEEDMKKTILSRIKALLAQVDGVEQLEIEVEGLGKLFSEDFSLDFIVYQEVDGEMKPLADSTFVYEAKEFKTDADGKIVEINDVVEEEVVAVELSDVALWEFKAEDGKDYYTTWLGLGEVVTDADKALVADSSFEYQGIVYATDMEGAISSISKNSDSPFWRNEDEALPKAEEVVSEVAVELKKLMKAELSKLRKELKLDAVDEVVDVVEDRADELEDVLEEAKVDADKEDVEALKAKISELEALINTMKGEVDKVKEENVQLKKLPTATKLSATQASQAPTVVGNDKQAKRAKLFASIK